MGHEIAVDTTQRSELVDITSEVQGFVRKGRVKNGICAVYVPHTSAGLVVNENFDPQVELDFIMVLDRLVPRDASYAHAEPNAPAHVMVSLIGSSETFLVEAGELVLGGWQGIFLAEFDGPRRRRVLMQVIPGTEEE